MRVHVIDGSRDINVREQHFTTDCRKKKARRICHFLCTCVVKSIFHHINYHSLESSWVSLVSLELQTMNFSQFADYFKFCLCSLSLVVNEC